ncbi:CPBP family intramembrane glutamic endopeptidase [Dyadobacter sp. CY356]|uniref:CPBP family intramembrane glutamic endopeptidase n=1 Tax=Dyadobacter sp. CY356 TaxID=2906442 RepID=UPI001F3AC3CC|nr:CPBP family intramembrane glutamic endopeptidase [Dyadobacter sp. CY356]MCF0054153.1 CPBP family intramembrane metalloprotease [Dyadobacter sp. CY356]
MKHSYTLFLNFVSFVRNPNYPDYLTITDKKKLIDVGLYIAVFAFIASELSWYLVKFAEKLKWYNPLIEIDNGQRVLILVVSAVAIAPFIEEAMFRFPLGLVRGKSCFKWVYYLSAVLFGWAHIFTYAFDSSHYFFVPLITLPQTFAGFILGYVRMIYGFWYGVLLHAVYNALCLFWIYIIDFNL